MMRAKRLLHFIPAIVVMAFIFYASSRTGDDLNTLLPFFHTLFPQMSSFDWGHFIAYFGLALSFYWALGSLSTTWKGKLLVIALCVVYGVTDEYHQTFVAGRSPDVADLRNDAIGAALAMLAMTIPVFERTYKKLRL